MGRIQDRLRASVSFQAHHGTIGERSVCAQQMLEAADFIDSLMIRINDLEKMLEILGGDE